MHYSPNFGTSVHVSGNDIYVVGSGGSSRNRHAMVWENAKVWYLPWESLAEAASVFVLDGVPYIVGTLSHGASIWKNHQGARPLYCDLEYSFATSVFVSGNDVYVVGYGYDDKNDEVEGMTHALLWKNGEVQRLSDYPGFDAVSVCVAGNDIYVAGCKNGYGTRAVLWKNGVMQYLAPNEPSSTATSVCVSGNDVIVGGYIRNASGKDIAVIWKNGIEQRLSDGTYDTEIRSVCAAGGNVYAAGCEKQKNGNAALLWKNGKVQRLAGMTTANCVFATAKTGGAGNSFAAKQQIPEVPKNPLDIPLVYVRGGTFTMGCTLEHPDYNDGHRSATSRVTLNSFFIGKYEVTQAQWTAVMGNNPSYNKGSDLPVDNVSWYDVQAFIEKLNGMTAGRFRLRLPNEAEWEYAARGGNKSKGYKHSGSNKLDDVAWHSGNSAQKTHPTGLKQPNELGIYDMSGNVEEWCMDWWMNDYCTRQDDEYHPIRGDGYFMPPAGCCVAKTYCASVGGEGGVGFRLAAEVDNTAGLIGGETITIPLSKK